MGGRIPLRAGWLACLALLGPAVLLAEPVTVRYREGSAQSSLVLSGLDGKILANGDLNQKALAGEVTIHVVFRFVDGSMHDETAVFSQNDVLRLLTYHLVQKGPTFPRSLDLTINAGAGRVTVRHSGEDGRETVEDEKIDLPSDIANGMMIVLLKNLDSTAVPPTASYIAATPKPRLVKLIITPADSESVSIAGAGRRATHYVVRAEIGGLAGLLAPLVGKAPPDNHVWILEGPAPAFLKSEGPLYVGGPPWRVEPARPVRPAATR